MPTIVRLSPLHRVELAEACAPLLDHPPEKDFPLHTVALKRAPDGRPLIHSELVIAGRQTREAFPLAREFPVHFLKSFHPWTFHGDPQKEFEYTRRAAEILGSPPPIGHDTNSFRTTFIPGRPLSGLSPFFGVEPPERNLSLAREVLPGALIGLWRLLEETFGQVRRLHAEGLAHGDLELHNVIVCTAPVRTFLIDYEGAGWQRESLDPAVDWPKRQQQDLREILRTAVYVQSALGPQEGPLAEACREHLPGLFRDPARFLATLETPGGLRGGGRVD